MASTARTSSKKGSSKAKAKEGNHRQRERLPPEAVAYLAKVIDSFEDPALEGGWRGGFCYVTYEGEPLCRLGYRGNLEQWDFAIFRWSIEDWGHLDLGPNVCSARDAIKMSLGAYSHL
jgi:hypothetical protein